MARAKKKAADEAAAPTPATAHTAAPAIGPGQRATLGAILVLVVVTGVGIWIWQSARPVVLNQPDYRLTPSAIEITPLPAWIRTDVKAEVVRNASLAEPLSILDDRLAEQISQGFALHPWVEQVVQVQKHHPARVTVELVYRRPVAMVEVKGGLLPIDRSGVLLPSEDFSPIEARRYPRIGGIRSSPRGPVGTLWGDPSVLGAAQTAIALGSKWKEWNLYKIVVAGGAPMESGSSTRAAPLALTLVTEAGANVAWGSPPGEEQPGEPKADEKISRLQALHQSLGSFDSDKTQPPLDVVRPEKKPAAK